MSKSDEEINETGIAKNPKTDELIDDEVEKKDDISITSNDFHSEDLDPTYKIPPKSNYEQYIDYRETSKTLMYLMGESKI